MPKSNTKKTTKVRKPTNKPAAKTKTRKIKQPEYNSFRLHKRIKHPAGKMPGSWSILSASLKHLLKNWKLFCAIGLIYAVLVIVLVRNLQVGIELASLKELFDELFFGQTGGTIITGFILFSSLLSSSVAAPTPAASVFQMFFGVMVSLAAIWALRQTYSDEKPRVKDAFYKGMYPLVPFILVIMVILLQLLPLFIGSTIFSVIVQNGLAVNAAEYLLWGSLFFLLALLSLYMVSSSIFALYIVTLPDITPMQALRSARELVRFRRWSVLRRVVMMPILLAIIGFLIALPVILLAPAAAEILFLFAALFVIILAHSYMYKLYRELL